MPDQMTFGLLCSGQGLQSATMFSLTAAAPQAAPIFEEAAEHLGCDPRRFVAEIETAALYENLTGQILCVTQALAAYECLKDTLPVRWAVAGYSVGELAAWSIAGAWTSHEVLSLVHTRADLMDEASCAGDSLYAVRGLDRTLMDELCRRHHCEIAIINPDRLFIIGGSTPNISRLCDEALAAGATLASPLSVNVASHTSRMAKAITPFQSAIDAVPARPLAGSKTLLSGVDGLRIVDPKSESRKLARQIGTQLDWAACLYSMAEAKVARLLELGPGRALTNMARSLSIFDEVRTLDDFRSVEGVRQWIVRP